MFNTEIKKKRLIFVYLCILAVFMMIVARMFFIVVSGDKVKVRGTYNVTKVSKRADIYDRNNIIVATDLKTKSLYASAILIKSPKSIAKAVSKVFPDLSYKTVLHKIKKSKGSRKWILLKRNLTPNQVKSVKNLKIAGLLFEDDSIRAYPQKSITSHLVGYVDLDRKGLSGIENQYNSQLAKGKQDVTLAMDIRVQDVLSDEMHKALEKYKAKAASGIILDVTNGEVLALTSLPNFDSNRQQSAKSNQRFNRVTNGVYELGSIFKTFTNAIAYEKGLIKIDDKYDIKEPITYGKYTIKDDHKIKDEMSVGEIFANSSNIGTVKIAQKIGIESQKAFFKKLGLLDKVPTVFPGLGRPIYPKKWREINLYTISYGHGIAVTPLHLASAIAATINGGTLYNPSFLKLKTPPQGKRIFKESTSKFMRALLAKTVQEGTGRKAKVEGYEVGGKTGTAERAELGGYNKKQTIASFVAAFPISNPKYLIYIVLDRPNYKFNTGGFVAAPVAGQIIKNIAPILGVNPSKKALQEKSN